MKRMTILIVLILVCFSAFAQKSGKMRQEFNVRMDRAHNWFDKKDYYKVITELDTLIEHFPESVTPFFMRGSTYFGLRDISAARRDFLKVKESGFFINKDFVHYVLSDEVFMDEIYKHYNLSRDANENGIVKTFGLKDSLQGALRPERTCYDVYYYDLTVKIIPEDKRIEGKNDIYFHTVENTAAIQIDLAENYQVQSIEWNGQALDYKRKYNALFVSFPEEVNVGTNQMVSISYSGIPHVAVDPPWVGGFVWEKKRGNWWVGVACEHLGASSWWPCKDHLSEKPDSMQINIQVPSKYQGIANGNLRSKKKMDDGYTQFEWFVSYPINSYGVTFYMGKFVNFADEFVNENGAYPIDYYVLPHHLKKAKKFYSKTNEVVEVYEQLFGEYPYSRDGMAMVEAPYEGMEHQSAIAIGDVYKEKNRRMYAMKDYNYLVVHEMAHEWWGNTVTMADMADAWISEGFATYSEHLFIEQKYGYEEYLNAVALNMKSVLNIWPMVGEKNVNDNTFLGGDIYNKGAALLHNLRCTINNDSLFFKMMKSYYEHFKFQQIDSKDFVDFVNGYTGKDYSASFNKFFYDTDPPVLEYSFTLENNYLIFSYKWINVEPDFTMPFSITVNNMGNVRLEGTTKLKTYRRYYTSTFCIPNEYLLDSKIQTPNSFTYFYTHWNRGGEK